MKIQPENTNMTIGKTLITEQKPVETQGGTVSSESEAGLVVAFDNCSPMRPAKQESPQSVKEMLTDALAASGFSTSKENIRLAMLLMENKLPVNKETLAIIKQAMLALGAENETKALFMVLNSLRPTEANINMLNSYITGDISLLENIETLARLVTGLDDPALKSELLKIISSNPDLAKAVMLNMQNNMPIGELSEARPLTAPSSNAGNAATEALNHQTQAFQAVADVLSQEITQALAQSASMHPDVMLEDVRKAVEQVLIKFSAELPPQFDSKEAVKNVLNELQSRYSLSELTGLATNPSKLAELRQPLQQLIEEVLIKAFNPSEAVPSDLFAPHAKGGMGREAHLHAGKDAITELAKALSFDPKDTTNKDINEYLNGLKEKLEAVKQAVSNSPQTETAQKLLKEISTLNENLNFFTHIKNNLFLQLPLHINDHFTNAELYIMKDRKAKSGQKRDSHSALIAIDTGSLGRFEAYVEKDVRSVNIQFRIETEFVETLAKSNIENLISALEQYGYCLGGCMYKRLTEAFTLEDTVKNDKLFVDMDAALDNGFEKKTAFDVRG